MANWHVYMIECEGGSIYTGIAVDVDARYAAHVAGRGAKYTRSNKPRRLLHTASFPDRSSASKEEYRIKQLSAEQKRALCQATGNRTRNT
jgi:putative endonuclease